MIKEKKRDFLMSLVLVFIILLAVINTRFNKDIECNIKSEEYKLLINYGEIKIEANCVNSICVGYLKKTKIEFICPDRKDNGFCYLIDSVKKTYSIEI